MRLVINVSLLVAGAVVIDLNDGTEDGTATVVHEQTMQYAITQVLKGPGDNETAAHDAGKDKQLQNVAALRLIARAHEQMRAVIEREMKVVTIPEVKKGEAN